MEKLRIPGPTPCPPEILKSMSRQMINHRSPEFSAIFNDVTAKLKQVFQTKNDILLFTSSGTGGLEAAIVNTLSPGDRVLSISNGYFAERFADIARAYGAEVTVLGFEWGKGLDINAVRKALQNDPKIKAVLVTHNESSTGVTNDISVIGPVVKGFGKLLLVDAVSSMGGINLPVDEYHCDVVATASQKAWMVPPGMAMVSVSQEAWQAHKTAKMPRLYFDFTLAKNSAVKGETPWTPAISIVFALSTALDMITKEGLSNVFARHVKAAKVAREGVKALGMPLFAEEAYASNTVTAVNIEGKVDAKKLLQILQKDYNIILAGGQAKLTGKIFRIGHLGYVNEDDMKYVISALKEVLPKARM